MRFRLIHGEQPLVDLGFRRKDRFIAQQDMQKRKLGNVAPQNHDADRERRRQDQARRSPQNAPKNGAHQQRQGRDSHLGAVKPRFEEVGDDQFQARNQQKNQQRPQPSIKGGQRERHRQRGGNQRSDVRHNSQNTGYHSPQRWI